MLGLGFGGGPPNPFNPKALSPQTSDRVQFSSVEPRSGVRWFGFLQPST